MTAAGKEKTVRNTPFSKSSPRTGMPGEEGSQEERTANGLFSAHTPLPLSRPRRNPFNEILLEQTKNNQRRNDRNNRPCKYDIPSCRILPDNPAISTVMVFAFPLGSTRYGIR